MRLRKKAKPLFKVGDWVSVHWGVGNVVARVIEDRGPIGVNGRRLYQIEIPLTDTEPARFEKPEEDMKSAAPPKKIADVALSTAR